MLKARELLDNHWNPEERRRKVEISPMPDRRLGIFSYD
jgi:hypothetical protein